MRGVPHAIEKIINTISKAKGRVVLSKTLDKELMLPILKAK